MKRNLLFFLLSIFAIPIIFSQTPLEVTILSDGAGRGSGFMENQIRTEIEAVMSSRYQAHVTTRLVENLKEDGQISIKQVYDDPQVQLIIGVGFDMCNQLALLGSYSKPTILTTILDNELQNIPLTATGTSGVYNLTYVQSPFNIKRDFESLYEILPFDKLAILGGYISGNNDFDSYFKRQLAFSGAAYQLIPTANTAAEMLAAITEDMDAAYTFPMLDRMPPIEIQKLMKGLADKGIPAFSLLSSPMLDLGAYAAYETDDNLQRIGRRVALTVLKIVEGEPAEALPVRMSTFTENLIINLQTARQAEHYPSWDVMAKAILINIESTNADRKINLESAIAEGLQNNLQIKIAEKDTRISKKDVSIAKSNLLPQIDASSTFLGVDENTIRNSFGTRGYLNWSANASLTQVILSEPAYANIAIQKFLLESNRMSLRQNELDIVLNVSQGYLNILRSFELIKLRNENVSVTRKNYDIAKAKEQVGYAGISDVFRWESELALDNIDLNNAQAQFRQARFNLNALLNRPIKEKFQLADVTLADSIVSIFDERLFPFIKNPGVIELFADFLVDEAFRNLPEIKQLEAAVAVQERSLKSQNRAFALPSIALSAQYDYPIGNYKYPEGINPIDNKPTYNAALGLQIPIFQGQSRVYQRQQTQIGLLQLQDQMKDLHNKLELQVRANLETTGASFSSMDLSRQSAEAAQKNFELIQSSYRQGLINVTALIDAQNAALSARINATNASYTFISDFLAVERALGYYHFLALEEDQNAFIRRFIQFIDNK